MSRASKSFEKQARSLAAQRVVHEPFEFDFIGEDLFTVGVPALAPTNLKRAVVYAAKTYFCGDPPSLATFKAWTRSRVFEPPKRGYYPLYLEIAYTVMNFINGEVDRILEKPRPLKHHGAFASGNALVRLQTSFRVACQLLRQYHWVELACILKLILEQLAWSYSVRGLEGDKLFRTSPTKAITALKQFYPAAGQMYGLLNRTSHVEPTLTGEYIEFRTNYPAVFLTSARNTAPCAYFLLLLADIYLLVSEFIHSDHYKSFKYLQISKTGVRQRARREILSHIRRHRRRLMAVQRRNPIH
jgi:hypothetical protein